jgi:hypothetical protein
MAGRAGLPNWTCIILPRLDRSAAPAGAADGDDADEPFPLLGRSQVHRVVAPCLVTPTLTGWHFTQVESVTGQAVRPRVA